MSSLLNRRDFLRTGALVTAMQTMPAVAMPARPAALRLAPQDFKRRLSGPIVSLPTPFLADGQIDSTGFRRMIARAQQHGIDIFELTAGDSQYSSLSYEETKELARIVVESTGEGGMTIIGTNSWWTERTIDFARYAESIRATALQVLKPTGAEEDGVVEHYRRVAQSTRLPIVLHGDFSFALLSRLVEIDSIVALKEDVSLSYYVDGIIRFGKRLNCFSGGGLDWFLVGQPYGSTAYFDSYATFAPEITVRFRDAVKRGDTAAEVEIIEHYDHPFIQNFSAPFWHATLEYFGVARRYLRAPQHSYTDAEMAKVKDFYDKLGVHPEKGLA